MTTHGTPDAIVNFEQRRDTDGELIDTMEVMEFLDAVREGGAINMFGADSTVRTAFKCNKGDARALHGLWMNTFGERHPR